MKFIVDNALSPHLSEGLKKQGFDSIHVRDVNLQCAQDDVIFQKAYDDNRIIVTADTDFGTLLANWNKTRPSCIIFRRLNDNKPAGLLTVLIANLPAITEDLISGSIIIIEDERIRVRKLPIF